MQLLSKTTYNRLSPHFTRKEVECSCGCGFDTADYATVQVMEKIRSYVGMPITVTSWCRCKAHNSSVGGAPSSKHITGRAVDFVIKGYSGQQYEDLIGYINSHMFRGVGGVRFYKNRGFVHMDTSLRYWR